MLTLPIKKEWFDMILSGEKKEEYREVKPYYTTRLRNAGLLNCLERPCPTGETARIVLRNGYGKNAPTAVVECSLRIKTGKPEWGAMTEKTYYALQIRRIVPESATAQ